jgi:hypothetical protein
MKHFQKLVVPALLLTGLLLTACTSSPSPQNDYTYKGINFGSDRDVDFRQGVRDACKTADGYYTKNHTLFKSNESYRIGWEDGRIQCKGK